MELSFTAKEKTIRLKAISSVAEGIAHEVRNPLNAISLNVQYLEKLGSKPGHQASPRDYQRVYRELGKIRKVVDNFVNFAKLRDLEITDIDMKEALNSALVDLKSRFRDEDVKLLRSEKGDLMLSADFPKLVQVIINILEQALDAIMDAENKVIEVEIVGEAKIVTVSVRDYGESHSEDSIKNMFDPYFSLRTSSLGLGLTTAKTVVESHGGKILAEGAPGGGCVVTLVFPRTF